MPSTAKTRVPVAATYYPHTQIQSEGLLKTALLLWDHVDCVVPTGPLPQTKLPARLEEATELVVRPRKPRPAEQERVHSRLRELLRNGIPGWLDLNPETPQWARRPYLIYPNKLGHETWQMFKQHGLARFDTASADYELPAALGLLVMAMLADECAGTTKRRVTDRTSAYQWLAGLTTKEAGGEYLPNVDVTHLAPTYDRLITISLEALGAQQIPLTRLVAMRKRELKGRSKDYQNLRRRYLERLDAVVASLVAQDVTESDRVEIERQFRVDMDDDLRLLKSELRLTSTKALFSKEIGLAAVAVAGAVIAPATWLAAAATLKGLGVGALIRTHAEYRSSRAKNLRDHSMSWLYVASNRRPVV
jgi:hypothetical protein